MITDAIKATGEMMLDVLALPFGEDRQGQMFDASTDVGLALGDEIPVFYYHGFAHRDAPMVPRIGRGVYRGVGEVAGKAGHVVRVILDATKEVARRVYEDARKGLARASSDSMAHLVRPLGIVGRPGRVSSWPVSGLSLMDAATAGAAVNPNAIALAAAKAILSEALDATEGAGGTGKTALGSESLDSAERAEGPGGMAMKAGAAFNRSNRQRLVQMRDLLNEMIAQFPPDADEPMTNAARNGETVDILQLPAEAVKAMIERRLNGAKAEFSDEGEDTETTSGDSPAEAAAIDDEKQEKR